MTWRNHDSPTRIAAVKRAHAEGRRGWRPKGIPHTDETKALIRAKRALQTNVKGGGPTPRPAEERFMEKVLKTESCWLWQGATSHGYGAFGLSNPRRVIRAHAFLDDQKHGPLPTGLERDHTCGNPVCVNPDHIERVTHQENLARASARRKG